jgi:hypothetical protein
MMCYFVNTFLGTPSLNTFLDPFLNPSWNHGRLDQAMSKFRGAVCQSFARKLQPQVS